MTRKLRRCPGCERDFLKGKKCLVETTDHRLVRKLCCLSCAGGAERIVLRAGSEPCTMPGCGRLARICTGCLAEALMKERTERVRDIAKQLRGTIAAMKMVDPLGSLDEESTKDPAPILAHYEGKIEGLESALGTVLQGCHPSVTKG